MTTITITPGKLTLAQLRLIARDASVQLALDPAAHAGIDASAATVARVLAENRTVYGINTGFGLLANTKIAADELELLQRSIVLSHAAGIGQRAVADEVRCNLRRHHVDHVEGSFNTPLFAVRGNHFKCGCF